MTQKLVNPVHFFDQRGRSILSNDDLAERNEKLEAENKRLRELIVVLNKQRDALRAAAAPEPAPVIH